MSFFLEGGGKKTGPSHPCNFIIRQCVIFLSDFVTGKRLQNRMEPFNLGKVATGTAAPERPKTLY